MNELTTWQEHLPETSVPQKQISKPLGRMESIALLSKLAIAMGSEAHLYSVRKSVLTMEQAEQLKRRYENDLPPEVGELYRSLTDRYLAFVDAIPQQFFVKLLAELQRVPADRDSETLLSKVRAWLG